jgi:hypothetical protein
MEVFDRVTGRTPGVRPHARGPRAGRVDVPRSALRALVLLNFPRGAQHPLGAHDWRQTFALASTFSINVRTTVSRSTLPRRPLARPASGCSSC